MDVLIDLDGTLVDPRSGLIGSIQHALDRLGRPVPPADDLLWMIGPPLRVSFTRLLGTEEQTEAAIGYYRDNYLDGAMYDAIVYDGIPDALEALRSAGCRLFVATAKPHYYARPILDHFDLTRFFAGIHGPELDGTHDHKQDLIAHIVASASMRPQNTIMVGDREHDVIAAARNSLRTIGVTWGYGSIEELTSAGAVALCATPPDLPGTVFDLSASPWEITDTVQLSHR